ncbi:MAG: hypothetical protein FJ387_03505 [Verrucomicrobia bacterium]|nr:hypothetical protein [Verrucomicrobiota bacterium]
MPYAPPLANLATVSTHSRKAEPARGSRGPGSGTRWTRAPSRSRRAGRALTWAARLGAYGALFALAAASTRGSQLDLEPIPRSVPGSERVGFGLLSPELTGIGFTNTLAESRSLTNHILLNGSGVAAGDVDGDGRCDLYLCRLDGPNALYRNLGEWRFEEVAARAGVACPDLDSTGAALADLDGDGDLDLLVSAIRGGVSCFLNDGHGNFRDATAASGFSSTAASMSLALADIDGDGDLDLYVANYRNETLRDGFRMQLRVRTVDGRQVVTMVNGRPLTGPDLAGWVTLDDQGNITENGQADVLYRNEGNGRFAPVPFTGGQFLDEDGRPLAAPLYDWTLTGMFRDLDGDGAPDLYVCSDMASPDRIWMNRGGGRFQAARRTAWRKTSWFSMGVDCADLDRDGQDEVFVTDMVSRDHRLRQVQISDHQFVFGQVGVFDDRPQSPRNTLFWNCGDGDYLELAYAAGLYATEWSWSPVFLDVDLDGYEDALIATGFERDVQDIDIANQLEAIRRARQLSDAAALRMRAQFPRLSLPNLAFRNRGDLTFEEVGAAWGFDTRGVSQGVALADLDNDGDLDAIVNNMNAAVGVYRNETTAPRLAVSLQGAGKNTRGIGAKIHVFHGAVPHQSQEMQAGGRYLSSDQPVRVFAAGATTNRLRVQVDWRSGLQTVLTNVQPNQHLVVQEPPATTARPTPLAPIDSPRPLFENVSARLAHVHRDQPFDDFARQSLLPKRLSQLGPGVAWADVNNDGWDDLVVGGGRGGHLAVLLNDGRGGFAPLADLPALRASLDRDLTGLVVLSRPSRPPLILAGAANYEDDLATTGSVRQFDLGDAGRRTDLPSGPASTGPVSVADVDGDGDLDLFVGGRVIAGRYPEPASSRLFRNQSGEYVAAEDGTGLFERLGLVSGAVFADLEGDGYPELVLACEWGPLRVYRNHRGKLTPWNPRLLWPKTGAAGSQTASPQGSWLSLEELTGWWNGVSAGDFDGDGRLDLLASNWGQNTKYQAYRSQPLRLYYGDFTGAGGLEPIETYHDPASGKTVPWLHLGRFAMAMPFVQARYPTFREFGAASVPEILGERLSEGQQLAAVWLETTLFLNRTNGFEVVPLPGPAQWSPAFAVCVADWDGDGCEDVFLSQNFFATEPETGRYDGGRGLCLRGDGRGGLHPWPARASGIRVYGEQRGAAAADFDADGRTDLVVTQNGASTQLFRNVNGKPGLRVRLRGPDGNPSGIGAVVRLQSARGLGPARELHAGSGYWSQDSAVAVLGMPDPPQSVIVRWPGGKVATAPVPPAALEVTVAFPDEP